MANHVVFNIDIDRSWPLVTLVREYMHELKRWLDRGVPLDGAPTLVQRWQQIYIITAAGQYFQPISSSTEQVWHKSMLRDAKIYHLGANTHVHRTTTISSLIEMNLPRDAVRARTHRIGNIMDDLYAQGAVPTGMMAGCAGYPSASVHTCDRIFQRSQVMNGFEEHNGVVRCIGPYILTFKAK